MVAVILISCPESHLRSPHALFQPGVPFGHEPIPSEYRRRLLDYPAAANFSLRDEPDEDEEEEEPEDDEEEEEDEEDDDDEDENADDGYSE